MELETSTRIQDAIYQNTPTWKVTINEYIPVDWTLYVFRENISYSQRIDINFLNLLFVCWLALRCGLVWLNGPKIWFYNLQHTKIERFSCLDTKCRCYHFIIWRCYTVLYIVRIVTYCILTVIYYNIDLNHMWKL